MYQDGPGGPTLRAILAALTPDDGEFVWTPADSGLGYGTHGLRIQVSLADNPLVMDRSQEPFSVPEDGQNYYVDDASDAGDEYTPAALGSNRHTGKLPEAPKPNPVNLFRVYAIGSDDVVQVDTGIYPMISPLALSGSSDRGLGLDEGFTLTGPVGETVAAELSPGHPGGPQL